MFSAKTLTGYLARHLLISGRCFSIIFSLDLSQRSAGSMKVGHFCGPHRIFDARNGIDSPLGLGGFGVVRAFEETTGRRPPSTILSCYGLCEDDRRCSLSVTKLAGKLIGTENGSLEFALFLQSSWISRRLGKCIKFFQNQSICILQSEIQVYSNRRSCRCEYR